MLVALRSSSSVTRWACRSLSSNTTTTTLKDEYEHIRVEQHDKVGLVLLHRPKALNALCDGLLDDLLHATQALQHTSNCVVLASSSPKAFAAGADIAEMQHKTFAEAYSTDMFARWQTLATLPKPLIASVDGYCLGGGCELAMLCDFIIATDRAQFGQPEVNLGILPGAGGTQRLARAMGPSKALYYCLTGEFFSAPVAYEHGLVAKLVSPSEDLRHETMQVAHKIAHQAPLAVRAIKEAVQASQHGLHEGLLLERRLFHSLFATQDQTEGMAAFLEKRKPEFKGK